MSDAVAPRAYAAAMRLLGADRSMRHFVGEILRPSPGDKLLDLGCGPGRLLAYLPPIDYVGLDTDAASLALARQRWPAARFEQQDVASASLRPHLAGCDLVVACGLLHHLDDAAALRTLRFARACLRPGGRIVTLDGALEDGQHWLARLLARADRGRHVRSARAYLDLVRTIMPETTLTLRHDLLRLPYTHAILRGRAA